MARFKSQEEFDAWKKSVDEERAKFDAELAGVNPDVMQGMRDINNYTIGDVLMLSRMIGPKEVTFKVTVENVNYNGNGLVTVYGTDYGTGAFDPKTIGVKQRYQYITAVKKIVQGSGPQPYRVPWFGLSHREAMRQYGVG